MAHNYRIMLRCPATGKSIDSGIRTSGRDVLREGLYRNGTISCPHCGQLHSFVDHSFREVEGVAATSDLWRPNP